MMDTKGRPYVDKKFIKSRTLSSINRLTYHNLIRPNCPLNLVSSLHPVPLNNTYLQLLTKIYFISLLRMEDIIISYTC